ncbi:oligopeptide ABC superfamily ATP binding cassette transporter, ABC protein [Sporosarcina newyorkensis 2681]|uniref:Oligopeptide ABC superfamily ATP binding cassette transporter, ABC protein n=1 Tax=Sporosarcina newyorkensis 2681 TaxID=1027292 RepID=F9DSA0_9BACL|nr:ABC transporter ATP-binding protein [Sporosarcina newyorkensis]EGQ26237.1 oligopeptide ABC superfamily ATP binding cassette transporter, ABC protein [Sporosarcina newyorkensis 2681]
MSTLLEINDLKTYFYTTNGVVPSVDGVSFSLESGQTTALVGESGCGKSVTSFSIMQLVNSPGKIVGGEILFKGRDLTKLNDREMRDLRGNEISMIFQEPLTSLNPILKIGTQLDETLLLHRKVSKKEAKLTSIEMLKKVGIPRAEQVYSSHPHELSGGMRQRVMIAMALSCNPSLLIADEPTTALDVTIQAQILKLMRNLKNEFDTSILLITHDLGVVAELADKVIVMYAGQVVEEADVMSLFAKPQHPYTQGLIQSTPKVEAEVDILESIKGNVPTPSNKPTGCYFHPRCPFAMDICKSEMPELKMNEQSGNKVRCWLHNSGKEVDLYGENLTYSN